MACRKYDDPMESHFFKLLANPDTKQKLRSKSNHGIGQARECRGSERSASIMLPVQDSFAFAANQHVERFSEDE